MKIVDILIRLGFLALLVAWCFQILTPFAGVILWGIILAIAMYPVHQSLEKRFKGRKKMGSTVLVLIGLIIIIIPTWLFVDSIIVGLTDLGSDFNSGNLTIPPPDPAIADWPLIGEDLHRIWGEASQSIENLLTKYREQLLVFGQAIFDGIKSIGGSLVTFILAVIIAGALLSSDYAQVQGRKFFKRLVGERGDEFIEITANTVGNVVKGVIGVAIIQAFLVGLGLLGAGVPYAGVWTLAVLILAILQLPVMVIVIFPIIMIFNSMETLPAVLWTVYLFAAGLSDTPLKAIFLGKGAAVPMLVIFLGVIGGFIMSGFIGLFTGAIVVSLGYTLFTTWLNAGDSAEEERLPDPAPETE
ncbi:AI-2E family transporter [Aureitalea marina]|nr:AI-2E family transporter [Aureitalea marina]